MLTALIEKLIRHEDLTTEEAAAAMREVMQGRVAPTALTALFSELRKRFSTTELVELTAAIATYNMIARFLVALQV